MILVLNDKIEYGVKKPEEWNVDNVYNYVSDNIGKYYQPNYLKYLSNAWEGHYGIVISPDILWYTLQCEICNIIKNNHEKYRSLFTEEEGKKEIIVQSGSLTELPLDKVISELKRLVPTDVDVFLPEFSTSTARSRTAKYAAFADTVSVYYNYSMYLCGIPAIDVQGTKEDWSLLLERWENVSKLLLSESKYVDRVTELLNRLVVSLNDVSFWKDIFYLERCGSGHQYELCGWFESLFRDKPDVRYIENYSSHISIVKYKSLSISKEFEMRQGIFSASIKKGVWLVPEFANYIVEAGEKPKNKINSLDDLEIEIVKMPVYKTNENKIINQEAKIFNDNSSNELFQ